MTLPLRTVSWPPPNSGVSEAVLPHEFSICYKMERPSKWPTLSFNYPSPFALRQSWPRRAPAQLSRVKFSMAHALFALYCSTPPHSPSPPPLPLAISHFSYNRRFLLAPFLSCVRKSVRSQEGGRLRKYQALDKAQQLLLYSLSFLLCWRPIRDLPNPQHNPAYLEVRPRMDLFPKTPPTHTSPSKLLHAEAGQVLRCSLPWRREATLPFSPQSKGAILPALSRRLPFRPCQVSRYTCGPNPSRAP